MYADKVVDYNKQPRKLIPYAGDRIHAFITDKGIESANTKKAYTGDINHFCKSFFGKEYMFVTEQELENIQHHEVMSYRADLVEEGKSAGTVNRKLAALHSLFEHLSKDNPNINHMAFKLKRLKDNGNSYGSLSKEEGELLVEAAKTFNEDFSVLVELAIATSIRQAALLSLNLKNISREQGVWIVNVVDKGKKTDSKPITDDLYARLVKLAEKNGGVFFDFKARTAQRLFKQACDAAGLDAAERNLTFHSLKKVAVNWILDEAGDVVQAMVQGNHSNMNVMYKHYIKRRKNYHNMAGIAMFQEEDLSTLEGLSTEELIAIIKECPKHVRNHIIAEAKRANESSAQ